MSAVDLFAGPGGWDVGAAALGIRPLGVEMDADACATREAAGHETRQADVAELEPWPAEVLIGSPPCPTFSAGGDRAGMRVEQLIAECAMNLAAGADTRFATRAKAYHALLPAAQAKERLRAQRRKSVVRPQHAERETFKASTMSLLVVEPLRWALATSPRLIALEQVPPVLPLWRLFAQLLGIRGYSTWAGVLNCADYGVPQTRERAFLLASRDGLVHPPMPTHAKGGALTLYGELAPWVSMADALGWPAEAEVGFPRLNDRDDGGTHRARDIRAATGPAQALTEKVRSWKVNTGRDWKAGGDRSSAQQIAVTEPAPTVGGTSLVAWTWERPATTLLSGDPRIAQPGHKRESTSPDAPGRMEDAVRVTLAEAALLQTFRADYPFHGNSSSQFRQVGNAVPPLMAQAVLAELTR